MTETTVKAPTRRGVVKLAMAILKLGLFARKDSVEGCRHQPSGIITGFDHEGKAIGRCAVCNVPIIITDLYAAPPLLDIYQRALAAETEADFLLNQEGYDD